MISNINPTSLYNSCNRPNFKGYNDKTYDVVSKNKQNWCLHETSFFRDIETMEFAKDYIVKNFPVGTNIADFGCSDGEEAYTLLMLLNKYNKDKKYKVTGYDISPKVLDRAQSGPFKINYRFVEGFVTNDLEYKDYDRKHLRELFFECFDRVPDKFLNYNAKSGDEEYLTQKINQEHNLKKLLELKCFREIVKNQEDFRPQNAFIPKHEFVDGVFDTKLGDINNISSILKPDGKTGAIFFKNAWYHVTGSRHTYNPLLLNLKSADNIMQAIYNILPQNGLLVVGSLANDHLYADQPTSLIQQNGQKIEIFNGSPFHDLLRQNKFKPIFYDIINDLFTIPNQAETHLPSVWRKI